MKSYNTMKLTTAAIILAFSGAAIAATEVMEPRAPANNDWQSSMAQEFSSLDASGNGLLLPHEASKGKAFNKKSFAAADADKDGTIDQNEYIQHKTNMGATNQPSSSQPSASQPSALESSGSMSLAPAESVDSAAENMSNKNIASDQPEPLTQTAEASQDSAANLQKGPNEMRADEMAAANKDADMVVADNTEPQKSTVGAVVDDSVITTKAKAAIFNTPDLKTLQISVETRQGEVVLSGMADTDAAKMKAGEVVKNVAGVTSVTNNLVVKR